MPWPATSHRLPATRRGPTWLRGAAFDPDILADYDLVLVGGGGTIDGSPNHTESGMALPLSGDAIRRSPTPLAFVALGYNLFPGQTLHCRDPLIDVLTACRERGFPFSVRNDSSHERLVEAVGDAARDVVEVPDPGFFVRPDRSYVVPQMTGRRPSVLVQLAGDNLDRRLGTATGRRWFARRTDRKRRAFTDKIADLVDVAGHATARRSRFGPAHYSRSSA